MKAIRVHEFGPPEVMKLEEAADLRPGPGRVLVRIKAAGVNPVDAYVRSGVYAKRPALPYTPGADAAGVVDAVGEGVTGITAGARVFLSGTVTGAYAGLALCEESQVHPLPDNVTFAQGAGVYIPYATAYRALFQRAQARPGETVLVHGASGGVGVAAVQLARAAGMSVIGTAGSERGRDLIKAQGAGHVLDHRAAGHLEEMTRITAGRGVDVVVEMLANVNLDKDLQVLAPGGRVVVVGSRGRVEIDPRGIMSHQASILGMMLLTIAEADKVEIFAAISAGLRSGTLQPVVGSEIPLAEAARAHHQIMETPAYGKIVLMP
ncbi:MAG: NADPH:quinone reductase [Candidatus Aminicenantales bacterium]